MAATDYYTVPTGNETKGFFELFGYVGTIATEGLFWPVMLFVIWIVTFISLKGFSSSRAWTFASFFCMVLSIMMAVMNYIAPMYMYLCIILFGIGLVWLKLDN